jgi:hypothetical protein
MNSKGSIRPPGGHRAHPDTPPLGSLSIHPCPEGSLRISLVKLLRSTPMRVAARILTPYSRHRVVFKGRAARFPAVGPLRQSD